MPVKMRRTQVYAHVVAKNRIIIIYKKLNKRLVLPKSRFWILEAIDLYRLKIFLVKLPDLPTFGSTIQLICNDILG